MSSESTNPSRDSASKPSFHTEGNDPHSEKDVASIRHHLRTPVHQILGYTELLQEDAQELELEPFVPDLDRIHTAARQVLSLIDESFDSLKIKLGKIDLEMLRYDMRSILDLIVGYTELIEEEAKDQKKDKIMADLGNIHRAAKTLFTLFDESDFIRRWEEESLSGKGIHFDEELAEATKSVFAEEELSELDRLSVTRPAPKPASVLIVDDDKMNLEVIARRLERQGHKVAAVENGKEALDEIAKNPFELVLLDVLMPVMDGMQTLNALKSNPKTKHIPVIMLSALNEMDNVIRCIEMGAEDYLSKPFNPLLLNARMNASLEKKRFRDQEQAFVRQLFVEREKSKRLLLNILPKSIADRQNKGDAVIADSFENCTILFANLDGLNRLSKRLSPDKIVPLLNDIYSGFDWLAEWHGFEKVNTLGDSYMVAGGVPTPRENHAEAVVEMALEMLKVNRKFNQRNGLELKFRIGIGSGPAQAGVIGKKTLNYYMWGETVNVSNRLEQTAKPGCIQVSASTQGLLQDKYEFEKNEPITIPGIGKIEAYGLLGRKTAAKAP